MIKSFSNRCKLRGGAMIEFAVLIPLMVILLYGCIDYGMQFHVYYQMANAARDAARLVAIADATTQQGIDLATNELAHFNTKFTITITAPAAGSTDTDVVVVISVPVASFSYFTLGPNSNGVIKTQVTFRKQGVL